MYRRITGAWLRTVVPFVFAGALPLVNAGCIDKGGMYMVSGPGQKTRREEREAARRIEDASLLGGGLKVVPKRREREAGEAAQTTFQLAVLKATLKALIKDIESTLARVEQKLKALPPAKKTDHQQVYLAIIASDAPLARARDGVRSGNPEDIRRGIGVAGEMKRSLDSLERRIDTDLASIAKK